MNAERLNFWFLNENAAYILLILIYRLMSGRIHNFINVEIYTMTEPALDIIHLRLACCFRFGFYVSAAHRSSDYDARAEQYQVLDDVLTFQRRLIWNVCLRFGRKENERQKSSRHLQQQKQQR